jgi:nitrogen fixation NifU-like protein
MSPEGNKYGEKMMDHFENPRNVGSLDAEAPNVGTGVVGSPACGDVMKVQIAVEDGRIAQARFKTFGCGSAIASSSLATEWITGRSLAEAAELDNAWLAEQLELPPVKVHCSVLAADAVRDAIADYRRKAGIDPAEQTSETATTDTA